MPSKQDDIDQQKYQDELKSRGKELENGPISNRSCTDIPCCLIFIAFIVGFFVASGWGFQEGDPNKLALGWDSDRNGCGYSEATIDYPYLYWPEIPDESTVNAMKTGDFDAAIDILNSGVCVKECPATSEDVIECLPTERMKANPDDYPVVDGKISCAQYIDSDALGAIGIDLSLYSDITPNIAGLTSYPFRYNTTAIGGFCVPNAKEAAGELKEVADEFLNYMYTRAFGDEGQAVFADIAASANVLAWSCLSALVLGYLFLFVIRCIGGLIIYVFLLVLLACLGFGGLYVKTMADQRDDADSYKDYMTWGAYALWVLAGIELLCICCCWSAIKIAIAVYKTTAQYVAANLRVLVLPLLSWILLVVWFTVWIYCAVHVASIGTVEPRTDLQFLSEVKWDDNTRYVFWYQLFGLLWVAAFINGVCQFVIAASACIWYFTVNSDTKGRGTVGTALYWGFRFHLGSIAFGSFIIAVVQFIRIMFEWYRRYMAKASRDNKVVKALLCLTSYCLYLLEKCVKYISKNAYIQVALTNDYFCKAAWNAFALILANAGRFGMATSVGKILNFFGVAAIAAVNGVIAFYVLTETDYASVQSPVAPIVLVCIISILIANTFLSIFGFSSDAILQSFLLDEQLRFQGGSRPEHMQEFAAEFEKSKKGGCC